MEKRKGLVISGYLIIGLLALQVINQAVLMQNEAAAAGWFLALLLFIQEFVD